MIRALPLALFVLAVPRAALAPPAPRGVSLAVPARLEAAVALVESGRNLNPRLRGAAGEWGRFQIRTATARALCPGLDVRTSTGNARCFRLMMREHFERTGSWPAALVAYNGTGPRARAYARRVLARLRAMPRAIARTEGGL